ncbi:MAG TPA: hypothetical protein VF318_00900 [Dehalococcoidales bacterium]
MKRLLIYLHKPLLGLFLLSISIALIGCAVVTTATPTTTIPAATSPTDTTTTTPTESATPTATPSPSATPTPSPKPPQPSVVIVSPFYNLPVLPGDIQVTVKINNFTIVDKIGQPAVAGEGHLIYYLDVNPPTDAGKSAATASGTFVETSATSYTWPNVAVGSHTLAVQLVNNDGTALNPPAIASEPVPVATPTATATPSPTATP